ncbi:hypothetical protein LINGRAHAP2_LOCUS12493 [Linum grandiflorum]
MLITNMQRWSPDSRSFVLVTGKSISSISIGKRILLWITLLIWVTHLLWVCMSSQLLVHTS